MQVPHFLSVAGFKLFPPAIFDFNNSVLIHNVVFFGLKMLYSGEVLVNLTSDYLAVEVLYQSTYLKSDVFCVGEALQYGVPITRGTWHLFGLALSPSLVHRTAALGLGGRLWIFCEPGIMRLSRPCHGALVADILLLSCHACRLSANIFIKF